MGPLPGVLAPMILTTGPCGCAAATAAAVVGAAAQTAAALVAAHPTLVSAAAAARPCTSAPMDPTQQHRALSSSSHAAASKGLATCVLRALCSSSAGGASAQRAPLRAAQHAWSSSGGWSAPSAALRGLHTTSTTDIVQAVVSAAQQQVRFKGGLHLLLVPFNSVLCDCVLRPNDSQVCCGG